MNNKTTPSSIQWISEESSSNTDFSVGDVMNRLVEYWVYTTTEVLNNNNEIPFWGKVNTPILELSKLLENTWLYANFSSVFSDAQKPGFFETCNFQWTRLEEWIINVLTSKLLKEEIALEMYIEILKLMQVSDRKIWIYTRQFLQKSKRYE